MPDLTMSMFATPADYWENEAKRYAGNADFWRERYLWLRGRAYKDGATLAIDVAVIDDVAIGDFGEFIDAEADAAIAGMRAVG